MRVIHRNFVFSNRGGTLSKHGVPLQGPRGAGRRRKLGTGVPPLRSESILEKLDFQKGALFKKMYTPLYTPNHQTARKSTNRTHVPCLQKKLEIKKLKTKKVTAGPMVHFCDIFFSDIPRFCYELRGAAHMGIGLFCDFSSR